MNKKEFYASPEAETFEMRFEGVVCQSRYNSTNGTEYYGQVDGGDL